MTSFVRHLKERSDVKKEMRDFGKEHGLDFSYMKSGSEDEGYSIGELCDLPKEGRMRVYKDVNSVYLNNVKIGPVCKNPLRNEEPDEDYKAALRKHSRHMIECDEEDAKGTSRIDAVTKAFRGFKKRHPRIVNVAKGAVAVGSVLLMALSGIHAYKEYNSYIKDGQTMNVSTEDFSKDSHLNELGVINVDAKNSGTFYFGAEHEQALHSGINVTGIEKLNGTSQVYVTMSGGCLYLNIQHQTDANLNLTEEQASKIFKGLGYDIKMKFDERKFNATKNATGGPITYFSGQDGKHYADVNVWNAGLVDKNDTIPDDCKMLMITISYDAQNETQIKKVLAELQSKNLLAQSTDELMKLVEKYPETSSEDIAKTINSAKFVKYWELPNGKPGSNATKYIAESASNEVTDLKDDNEFKNWSAANKDVLENGSLVEVLESIDEYISMTSVYKESKNPAEEFVCAHYADKYIYAFNNVKNKNENLQGTLAFKVSSSKTIGTDSDSGHMYVGIMSMAGDKTYVSFIDPTWSDDCEVNLAYKSLTGEFSKKEILDALDGYHHIELNNSQNLEQRADSAKENAVIIGGLQVSAELTGLVAGNYALTDKKPKKIKKGNSE